MEDNKVCNYHEIYSELARLQERLDAYNNQTALALNHADIALRLRTKELDRRLDILNNEYTRIDAIANKQLSKEIYEYKHNELILQHDNDMKFVNAKIERCMQGKVSWSVASIVIFLTSVCVGLITFVLDHSLR